MLLRNLKEFFQENVNFIENYKIVWVKKMCLKVCYLTHFLKHALEY